MNKNIDIIKSLLEKDLLTEDDKKVIAGITAKDSEAFSFYKDYLRIVSAIRHHNHIAPDILAGYLLLKDNPGSADAVITASVPAIEEHIRKCPLCAAELIELSEELNDVSSHLAGFNSAHREEKPVSPPIQQSSFSKSFFRYAFASVVVTAFIYASLFFFSKAAEPDYLRYAALDDESGFYVTRGRLSEDFRNSINAFDADNINDAIAFLKKDIESGNDSETVFYSHYLLGLAYLETAYSDFLGLFPSYSAEKAELALEQFNLAAEKNNSGRFPDINLNAHFYSAKASLMLGRKDQAIRYFNKVIDGKGSKMNEAERILKELE